MFKANYIINGKILCETGLHIGGSNDNINIGGSDNVVIRESISNLPYIPGSSLKGKLRKLLEFNHKISFDNIKENDKFYNDLITNLFGASGNKVSTSDDINILTKIIVRDSYPTEDTIKLWDSFDNIIDGSELKYENKIDTITSEANPRNIERVPRGSIFNFEIIVGVSDNIIFSESKSDEYEKYAKKVINLIFEGLRLLEDDYLGGSGSRGFGKIKFFDIVVNKKDSNYYKGNSKIEVVFKQECKMFNTKDSN